MRREFLLACVLCCTWNGILAISKPPLISLQPEHDVFFKEGETVTLPCESEASSNASYTWKKNGVDFNPGGFDTRIYQDANTGTIVFKSPASQDEGIYQCFASNDYGKSATIKINLREAKLLSFAVASPRRYSPQLGSPLTLMCIPPESVPPPNIFWAIRDPIQGFKPINLDARVTMDHEYRLHFTNVKSIDHQDGNAYLCMAMNSFVRRNTIGPDHIISPQNGTELMPVTYLWASPSNVVGLLGETFKIKCIFGGSPTPTVSWTVEGGRLLPDNSTMLESFGQELVFKRLEFSDNGTYTCSGQNDQSPQLIQRSIYIRVESKPYWIEEPKNLELGVGETARFKCVTGAIPIPDVHWFVNAVPLGEVKDTRIDQRFQRVSPNEIVLTNVTANDSMVFQCNSTNKHGYIWKNMYLNVIPDSAPIITVPPAEVAAVAEGQSVNLTCRVSGKPDPVIMWYRNGAQITGGRYRTLRNGDLHLENVVLGDAGTFTCMAANIYGSTSATGVLMVRRKTRIVQKPVDLVVNYGSNAVFFCSATTDPAEAGNLQIKWMKDNRQITALDQRMTTTNQNRSLTISRTIVRDSGIYTCVATNGLDNASASAMLTVRDRPDPPFNVRLDACTGGTATIRWNPGNDNNAPIQYYTVQYNTSFDSSQWVSVSTVYPSQQTEMTATIGLSPYANYTFRVLANNMIGRSPPSLFTRQTCRTQPSIPFKNPENVRTIGDKKNSLHIVWTAMLQIEHNGPGFEYILYFKRRGDMDSSSLTYRIEDWKQTSIEVPTFDTYKPYEIILKSRNALGEARQDAQTIIGYSGEDVPTIAPTDLRVVHVEGHTATLAFIFAMNLISVEDTPVRGEFKGFKFQTWQRNLRETTMKEWDITREQVEQDRNGHLINATLRYLKPNTDYEARVAVMNNFYVGKPSDIIQFRTGQEDMWTTATPRWRSSSTTTRGMWKTTTTSPRWRLSTTTLRVVTPRPPDGCDVSFIGMCTNPLFVIYDTAKGDKTIICPAADRAVSCLNSLIACVNHPEFTRARNVIDYQLKLPDMCPMLGQYPTASATTLHSAPLMAAFTLFLGCVIVNNANK